MYIKGMDALYDKGWCWMRDVSERNLLVEENLWLAQNLARQRHKSVSRCVQYDELLSAAYVGLIDAAKRYNESLAHEKAKFPFVAYARLRIYGEMTDYLRSCSWGSRNYPQKMGSLNAVRASSNIPRSDQSELVCDGAGEISDDMNSKELFEKIIKSLPKMVKDVFRLRYLSDMTMKDVSEQLNISESRVSQIISQNSDYLKDSLETKKSELWEESQSSRIKRGALRFYNNSRSFHRSPIEDDCPNV